MRTKIYTFTFSVPHHAAEGDWWCEMIDNFEVLEVLSETAFLCRRIGLIRVLWLRLNMKAQGVWDRLFGEGTKD